MQKAHYTKRDLETWLNRWEPQDDPETNLRHFKTDHALREHYAHCALDPVSVLFFKGSGPQHLTNVSPLLHRGETRGNGEVCAGAPVNLYLGERVMRGEHDQYNHSPAYSPTAPPGGGGGWNVNTEPAYQWDY